MKHLTLYDIEKRSGNDMTIGMIEEIGLSAPEVTQIAARSISGTSYKTFIRTGVPRIGFRQPNAPATFVTSKYENRTVELFPISTVVFVDNIILSGAPDGESAVLADETNGVGQGCLLSIGAQIFYGKRVDEDGFYGLDNMIDDSMILSADESKPAESNDGTSVYAVVEGPTGVQLVTGNGKAFNLSAFAPMTIQKDNGVIPGKGAALDCWVALANHSKLTAARLKNIGDTEGTTLDDKKLIRHSKPVFAKETTHGQCWQADEWIKIRKSRNGRIWYGCITGNVLPRRHAIRDAGNYEQHSRIGDESWRGRRLGRRGVYCDIGNWIFHRESWAYGKKGKGCREIN